MNDLALSVSMPSHLGLMTVVEHLPHQAKAHVCLPTAPQNLGNSGQSELQTVPPK